MQRASDMLTILLNCKDEVARQSGCFLVYQNLHAALQDCQKDEKRFATKFPEVVRQKNRIVAVCKKRESSDLSLPVAVRREWTRHSFHLIGALLQAELAPRFVKENTRADGVSEQDHIAQWFRSNANVNPETDQTLIFAGFLAMFEM